MAVMSGVDYRPISYAGVPRMSRYDVVCVHTIVGNDPAPAAHFSTRGDGHTTQNRDTAYRSAANYQGNHRVIAIENDDFGPEFGPWSGSNVPPFTAEQCEAIARICAWAHRTHGIPLVLCPDSKPGSRGIAYHRQGIKGNWAGYAYGGWVPGGEVWSLSTGKVCPGDRRITQLINVIIPRARVLAGLQQEDTVTDSPMVEVAAWRTHAIAHGYGEVQGGPTQGEVMEQVRHWYEMQHNIRAMVAALNQVVADIAALKAKVDQLSIGGVDYATLADAVQDEADRRARDGDSATGPTT